HPRSVAQGVRGVAALRNHIGEQCNCGREGLKRLEQGDVKAAMAKQPSCQVAASPSASAATG
ncbi:small secreted protein, partial [Streptomyces diastatochromogenes]